MIQKLRLSIRQTVCGIIGHDHVKTTEGRRLTMICTLCKHDTGGVELTGAPKPRYAGDPKRHRMET